MEKFKPKLKRPRLIPILIFILVAVGIHAAATVNNSERMKSIKLGQSHNVSAQTNKPVIQAENASKKIIPTPPPAPAPIDPNGCEAKGMWWRADNYECIAKPASVVPVTAATPSTPAPTPSIGTGDCSLVNNYDWPHDMAMRVCMKESGGNPNNQNWTDYHKFANCYGSFGLMQINCSHGQVYDGVANMAIAYSMWVGAGRSFLQGWPNTCAAVGC